MRSSFGVPHLGALPPRTARASGILVTFLCLVILLVGCERASQHRTPSALGDDAITIGSFDFDESELLAEIYAVALENAGFEVKRMFRLGPREIVQPALADGLIEFVPEYSGTALQFLSLNRSEPTPDVEGTHAALSRALAGTPLVALAPAPAQDANAFVVSRRISDRFGGLDAISDLEEMAPTLTLGGPPECPTRPFCLRGLEEVYDLRFDHFLALDTGGPITRQALRDGHADVALLFTTDPGLESSDLVVLADDRRLQPAENVTPLVHREVLNRWGTELEQVVNAVSSQMTTADLRGLNAQVAEGLKVSTVARRWFLSEGIRP
jgi:osmoprotectant transport system substrate-binding protein